MSGFFRDARGLKPRNNIFEKIRGNAVSIEMHHNSEPQRRQLTTDYYNNVEDTNDYTNNVKYNNESYDTTVGNSFKDDEYSKAKVLSTVNYDFNKYQYREETQKKLTKETPNLPHDANKVAARETESFASEPKVKAENATTRSEESTDNDDCEITDIKELSNEPPNKPAFPEKGNHSGNSEFDGSADTSYESGTSDTSVYSHSNEVLLEAFTNTQRMCSVLKTDLDKSKQENHLLSEKNHEYKNEIRKIKGKILFMASGMESMQNTASRLTKAQDKYVLKLVEMQKEHTELRKSLSNATITLKEFHEKYQQLQAEYKQLEVINLQKSSELEVLERKILAKDNGLNTKFDEFMEKYDQGFGRLKIALFEKTQKLTSDVQGAITKQLEQGCKSTTKDLSALFLEKFKENTKCLEDCNLKEGEEFEKLVRDTEMRVVTSCKEIIEKLNSIDSGTSSNHSNLLEYINGNIVLKNENLHELVMDEFVKSAESLNNFDVILSKQLAEISQKTIDSQDFKNVLGKQASLAQENTNLTHKCSKLETEKQQNVMQASESKQMIIELSKNLNVFKTKVDSQEQDFKKRLDDQIEKMRNLENLKKSQDQIVELLEKDNKALKLDLATYTCDECLANNGLKDQMSLLEKQLQELRQEKIEFQEKIFSLENQLENLNIRNNTHTSHIVAKNAESTKHEGTATSTTATSDFELVSSAPNLEQENTTLAKTSIVKKKDACVTSLPREMSSSDTGKGGKRKYTDMKSSKFELMTKKMTDDVDDDDNGKDDPFADQTLSFNTQLKTLLDTASKYKRKSSFAGGKGNMKFANTESPFTGGKRKNAGSKIRIKTATKTTGASTNDVGKKINVSKSKTAKSEK
ncbi:hypothetical protein ACO0QE_000492 [Hanseniaspora vineae]